MADPVPDRIEWSGPDYARLIRPDRVHGSLYVTQLLDPSADRWRDA